MTHHRGKRRLSDRGVTNVWLGLIGATLLMYALNQGTADIPGAGPRANSLAIIAIGFVEMHLVISWFMDIHNAPPRWRIGFGSGIAATFVLVLMLSGAIR